MTEFGTGVDPVGVEARFAAPERDARSGEIEPEIGVDIHYKYNEPLDPDERTWEQRAHYVFYPSYLEPEHGEEALTGFVTAGFVFWLGGSWWWRPSWHGERGRELLDMGARVAEHAPGQWVQEPSVELDVETEEDAILHARRRLAWELAG